jgi:hypothetical protein
MGFEPTESSLGRLPNSQQVHLRTMGRLGRSKSLIYRLLWSYDYQNRSIQPSPSTRVYTCSQNPTQALAFQRNTLVQGFRHSRVFCSGFWHR